MSNLESEFKKELKKELGVYGAKDIYKIPLPDNASKWFVSGTNMYYIQGIEDKYYSKLNNTYVQGLPKGMIAKKRIIDRVNRCYKKNEDGKYLYEDVKIPIGCVVITSEVDLGLPFKYKVDEYGYIDYVIRGGKKRYLYYISKKNLYKAHQTALALSVKNMKNYAGKGYSTWRNGVIYLHIIPYNPRSSYIGTKILRTSNSIEDYGKCIQEIVNYWQNNLVIPNIGLCSMSDGENLVLKDTEVGYADFIPYDMISIGDREVYGTSEDEE